MSIQVAAVVTDSKDKFSQGTQSRERACAGCKAVAPPEALLRFTLSPAKELTFDLKAKLPGRGTWACPTLPCLKQGVIKRGFARSLHTAISVDPMTLGQAAQHALRRHLLQDFGLCYRSSQCSFGMDRCLRLLAQGNVHACIVAQDLSCRSAQQLLEQNQSASSHEIIQTHFSKKTLGEAFGRQEVGIISILDGKLAQRLLTNVRRLCQLETSLQHKQLCRERP